MSLPQLDFAVIGAGKCGTTSLYHALRAHPEVFLPSVKETNFFALRGLETDAAPDPEQFRHWPEAITRDDITDLAGRVLRGPRVVGAVGPFSNGDFERYMP